MLKTVLACAGVVAFVSGAVATAKPPAPLPMPFAGATGAQTFDENVAHAGALAIDGKLPGK